MKPEEEEYVAPWEKRKKQQCVPNVEQKNEAMQTAIELMNTQKRLGLSLEIYDKNLNKISGKFDNMADLMRNPEFISRLNQDLYISSGSERTWFKLTVKHGKITTIKFLLTFTIRGLKIINYTAAGFDYVIVNYLASEGKLQKFSAIIPNSDFTPDKICKHFPQLIGQTANNTKEIGKLICNMLSPYLIEPNPDTLEYYGFKQGFAKNLKGQFQFNPSKKLPVELQTYIPVSLSSREYPRLTWSGNESKDMTSFLIGLFNGKKNCNSCSCSGSLVFISPSLPKIVFIQTSRLSSSQAREFLWLYQLPCLRILDMIRLTRCQLVQRSHH